MAVDSFSSRTALAAVSAPVNGQPALLTEAGREGLFYFSTANLSAKVTADTGQGVYVPPSSDSSGTSGAWVRKDAELFLRPEWFGAVGTADDQPTFDALNAVIVAHNGATIELRPITYRGGRQILGGDGWYLDYGPMIRADGVSFLRVNMNGATLKLKDGLKFGTFDPSTGLPIVTPAPYFVSAKAARLPAPLFIYQIGYFSVHGPGTIDGNSYGITVGGEYGDTGRQLPGMGINIVECAITIVEGITIRNCLTDCLHYAYNFLHLGGTERAYPVVIRQCVLEYAARNCLTISGTNSMLVEQCLIRYAGEAPNAVAGTVSSSPKANINVEAESSHCRNVAVRDSHLVAGVNTHTSFVADSGDSADLIMRDCLIFGTFYTSKKRTRAYNCRFYGAIGRMLGGQADPADNTLLENCIISDVPRTGSPATTTGLLDFEGAGSTAASPAELRNCNIEITRYAVNMKGSALEGTTTINVSANTATLNSGSEIISTIGSVWQGKVTIKDLITTNLPALPYYISGLGASTIDGEVTLVSSGSAKLRFDTSGGATGLYPCLTTTPGDVKAVGKVALGMEVNLTYDLAIKGVGESVGLLWSETESNYGSPLCYAISGSVELGYGSNGSGAAFFGSYNNVDAILSRNGAEKVRGTARGASITGKLKVSDLPSATDDAAAAIAGVAIGELYQSAGSVRARLV